MVNKANSSKLPVSSKLKLIQTGGVNGTNVNNNQVIKPVNRLVKLNPANNIGNNNKLISSNDQEPYSNNRQ